MTLLDALKTGGLPGFGFTIGQNAALGAKVDALPAAQKNQVADLLKNPSMTAPAGGGLFNLSFGDKFLFTLLAGTALTVVLTRALKNG